MAVLTSVMPRRTLSSVVLPHPDEPSMETICPSWMARSISSSTTCAPYAFWMCLNSSMGLPHGFWRRHDHREGIVPRARKRPARRPLRLPMHVKGYGKEGRCRLALPVSRSQLPASRSRLLAGRSRPFARRSPLLAKRRPRHVPTSCHGDVRAIGGDNARAAARPDYCTALT